MVDNSGDTVWVILTCQASWQGAKAQHQNVRFALVQAALRGSSEERNAV